MTPTRQTPVIDPETHQPVTSYRAWIGDGGGDTLITADSMDEALAHAREWAADGDYDHPGTVTLYVTPLGADGDGISGYLTIETVAVG